jgi:hypothetical protein
MTLHFGRHVSATLRCVNPEKYLFFLVHGASTKSVIYSTEYLNQNRMGREFSEPHTMIIITILRGQQNSWGLFENTGLGGTCSSAAQSVSTH